MAELSDVVMNPQAGRFELTQNGVTAFAEYRLRDGDMLLPHTVVPPPLEGHGIGGLLAQAALGYARLHRLRVKPACSFMAAYITRHPDWRDVVHPSYRARLGLPEDARS
jgi:predicted GNAT family acetyltransferase